MISNPEFKRHLWQEISAHRLIAMPAILFLLLVTVSISANNNALNALRAPAFTLFVVIVLMWGTRNVSACLIDEWRDQTWDQQRMSALSPWRMTWGKLLGATIFQWYGGVLCLLVLFIALFAENSRHACLIVASLVALAVLLHAANLAITLHIFSQNKRGTLRNNLAPLLFLLLVLAALLGRMLEKNERAILWWHFSIETEWFWFVSIAVFALWAVFGAWRVMKNAMQEPSVSWVWPCFALFMGGYFAGFHAAPNFARFALWALVLATVMSYAAILSCQHHRVQWQALQLRAQRGDWLGFLQRLPMWLSGVLLVLVLSVVLQFHALGQILPDDDLPPILKLVPPIAIALMLLRDTALLYFFALAKQNKRAMATTVLYLALINSVLPIVAALAKQTWLTLLIAPLALSKSGNALLPIIGMALHFAIAAALLRWRWKNLA